MKRYQVVGPLVTDIQDRIIWIIVEITDVTSREIARYDSEEMCLKRMKQLEDECEFNS